MAAGEYPACFTKCPVLQTLDGRFMAAEAGVEADIQRITTQLPLEEQPAALARSGAKLEGRGYTLVALCGLARAFECEEPTSDDACTVYSPELPNFLERALET
ncbi:MAG TPA: hypothetical protein VLH38_03645 [Patescibacteria group bacterium]|nr:hypothetical protein [Patescibacteria group bacterium]